MLRHVQLLQVCDAITGFLGNQRNIISKTEAISSTDHKGWCYFYQGTKLYHDNQARLPKMSIDCNSNTTLTFANCVRACAQGKIPRFFRASPCHQSFSQNRLFPQLFSTAFAPIAWY